MNRRYNGVIIKTLLVLLLLFCVYSFRSQSTVPYFINSVYNTAYDIKDINDKRITQDNLFLIDEIRKTYLYPPPKSGPYYNLEQPEPVDPSMGQSEKILEILKDKRGGFFVECGGLDGETRSNTLYMERFLGWSGLIIEADPINFSLMRNKKRNAWLSNTCLSINNYPEIVTFQQAKNVGKISDKKLDANNKEIGYTLVQCIPFYSFLLALNQTTVDYFSLDVEGNELDVLRTIPFDLVDIKTLSVEYIHDKEGKEVLRNYMEGKGYVVHSQVTHPNNLANDFIFVKK